MGEDEILPDDGDLGVNGLNVGGCELVQSGFEADILG